MVLSEFPLYEGLGSVKADATSTCQTCGARVPAGLDFCPVCALLRAGGQESAPSEALNPVPDSERNSAETEPSSIVRRFENYEVMLDQDGNPIELGRGAMGITYKAFDARCRSAVSGRPRLSALDDSRALSTKRLSTPGVPDQLFVGATPLRDLYGRLPRDDRRHL
jgi:hypothetical protein